MDLGPALVRRGEHYHENERTKARVEGIERLRANYPWAGVPHFQTFLAGFDEGEKYGMAVCQHQSSLVQSHTESKSQDSSFISLSESTYPNTQERATSRWSVATWLLSPNLPAMATGDTWLAGRGKNACHLEQKPTVLVAIGRQGPLNHHLERIHASKNSPPPEYCSAAIQPKVTC